MGNKISRKATLWLLVLFAVFLFAPFSSSADDGYDVTGKPPVPTLNP